MRLIGITHESIVDGPGIRVVVFAQGCTAACPHCHNPDSWTINGGQEYTVRQVIRMIRKPGPGRKKVQGVTFSGGEPFLQAGELAQVAFEAKRIGWDVVTYTGYTYEEILRQNDAEMQTLLNFTDYLIDGPYIHEKRERNIPFRGSTNQRIINMEETRKRGRVVLFYPV
jgi:anaerobic ribonucleoside-triphosphate reductase activating protein